MITCWYTTDSGDKEDKDWRTQSISAPILSSEAGNWGEKTRRRVGSVCAQTVSGSNSVSQFRHRCTWFSQYSEKRPRNILVLWHLRIYQYTIQNRQWGLLVHKDQWLWPCLAKCLIRSLKVWKCLLQILWKRCTSMSLLWHPAGCRVEGTRYTAAACVGSDVCTCTTARTEFGAKSSHNISSSPLRPLFPRVWVSSSFTTVSLVPRLVTGHMQLASRASIEPSRNFHNHGEGMPHLRHY